MQYRALHGQGLTLSPSATTVLSFAEGSSSRDAKNGHPNFSAHKEADISDITAFLEQVFADTPDGYVAVGLGVKTDKGQLTLGEHRFYRLSTQYDDLTRFCEGHSKKDVYFSVAAFSEPVRSANDERATSRVVYADADGFEPGDFRLAPSIRVQTSPGNYHAYWVLDRPYGQHEVSEVARKISKAHNLDPSSGIPTKLLRVPGTVNTKYSEPYNVTYTSTDDTYTLEEIAAAYGDVEVNLPTLTPDADMPDSLPDWFDVMGRIPHNERINDLLEWDKATSDEPHMRSERRYELCRLLIEVGMSPEDALVAVWQSALADHYREQNRGIADCWKFDVLPALAKEPPAYELEPVHAGTFSLGTDFISQEETEWVFSSPSFVDRWEEINYEALHPKTPSQYIRINGYTLLAAIFGNVCAVMPPSVSRAVFTNLYVVNSGETTSGKSEALFFLKRYIKAFEKHVGYDIIVGSNATAEGMIKALKTYNKRSAVITTEEVSGKFRQWQNSSSMAHAREAELEIYDNYLPKNLRAGEGAGNTENVHVAFTQYMMGVDSEIESILDRGFLRSGYLPRCVIVKGTRSQFDDAELLDIPQGDPDKVQDVDPLPEKWAEDFLTTIRKQTSGREGKLRVMQFEDDAWARFLVFRAELLKFAEASEDPDVVRPMAIRFALSCQKMMALLAFERRAETVELLDVLHVLQDAQLWWGWAMQMIQSVQDSAFARLQEDVLDWLRTCGGRARLSAFHTKFASLPMRERADALDSLRGRNVLRQIKTDKGIDMLEMLQ